MPSHETTWMLIANFISQFPSYALEGKFNDGGGGGIDKCDRCQIRSRKREKEGIKRTEDELEVEDDELGV